MDSIERASELLRAYPVEEEDQDDATTLRDVLTDLRHYFGPEEMDAAQRMAEMHYEAEIAETDD